MNLKTISKDYLLIILSSLLFLYNCKSKKESFDELVVSCLRSEKSINQSEYQELSSYVEENPDTFKNQLDNQNKVIPEKLREYILSLPSIRKFSVSSDDIWLPSETGSDTERKIKFNVNVFLENSGSMDGYVKGKTQFETAIYSMLGDIKIGSFCDSLNLNYINDTIPLNIPNLDDDAIADFIEKLEPDSFMKKGGKRISSDMSEVLEKVLSLVNEKNLSIFISDCVFSPGKEKVDAEDYLSSQSVGIKVDFAKKIGTINLSVLVLRLESDFTGKYYNKRDYITQLNKTKRPYFIWFIGTESQITQIIQSKITEKLKGGYTHKVLFSHSKTTEPDYKILLNGKTGAFSIDKKDSKSIVDAKKETRGQQNGSFGFNIAIRLDKYHKDSMYLLNPSNYSINPNYKLKIETIDVNKIPTLKMFTHILKLTTEDLRQEEIKITLKNNLPEWIKVYSSSDDSDINNGDEAKKTFGFNYLMEGINDAYATIPSNETVFTIKVTVNKQK